MANWPPSAAHLETDRLVFDQPVESAFNQAAELNGNTGAAAFLGRVRDHAARVA